jgi:hypothetical protein
MVIKINYTSSDVYVSTSVSPVYVVVNYSAVNNGGGGAIWGGITGTLSDQTDLQDALDAKFDDPTGTTSQYLRGDGSLATFPSLTGFVPYTGATTNVDLGTHRILAQNATIASSGSGDTVTLNHSSGSGIGLNITKGGSGEGLYVNKTSGSGNAATIIGTLNATSLVKSGGTSSQFLKADGSVDSTTYVGGSGTSGQVAYWNGTSSQTGSNNLFWDTVTQGGTLLARGAQGGFRIGNYSAASGVGAIWNQSVTANNTNYILASSANEVSIQGPTSLYFQIGTSATTYARIFSTGNFALQNGGTFTDGGQRLQVQGDAFIKGSGATSATTALQIQNSSNQNILQVFNDGMLKIGNANNAPLLYPGGGPTINSQALTIGLNNYNSWGNGESAFTILTNTNTTTTGTSTANSFTGTFAPGSGGHNHNFLRITATINQTGGANGITRGLFIQPFITSAADWRSIEWSNNSGWGLYGAGTANNYLGGSLTINDGSTYAVKLTNNKRIAGHDGSGGSEITLNLAAIIAGYSSLDIRTQLGGNITFQTNGANTRMQVFGATGNVVLQNGGTFTDAGFRLDVNGTARVSGELTVNTINIGRGGGGISNNTRVGVNALNANTTGTRNTAVGSESLLLSNGSDNTSIGARALFAATTGSGNVAIGSSTLNALNTGGNNVAIGGAAMSGLTTGTDNIAIGIEAGRRISGGSDNYTNGTQSIFIGFQTRALADGNNNQIVIGHGATGAGSNTATIGNTSITKTILRGTINAANLPTSPVGLSTGDIWNNLGILTIV